MPSSTKTIAFRVSISIEEQIQQIAKANGQSKGDWVRDQLMQAIHAMNPTTAPKQEEPISVSEPPPDLLTVLEARFQEVEHILRDEIQAVKTAIREVAKSHHRHLCTLGQIGLDAQDSIEQKIEAAGLDSLDALERLKQSQRSHKDTLLEAFRRPPRNRP
jgi:hypothetical protein